MEGTSSSRARLIRRAFAVLVSLAIAGAALAASYSAASPTPYPGVALGWSLLYHVERAGLLLGIVALFVLVVWRALNAEFPIKFGQILEYAPREALPIFERMQANLEERIATLEDQIGIGIEPGNHDD
jgi:hypothetical protein